MTWRADWFSGIFRRIQIFDEGWNGVSSEDISILEEEEVGRATGPAGINVHGPNKRVC